MGATETVELDLEVIERLIEREESAALVAKQPRSIAYQAEASRGFPAGCPRAGRPRRRTRSTSTAARARRSGTSTGTSSSTTTTATA